MKERLIYLDNICGILLLHMIYTYHIANTLCFKPVLIHIIGIILSFFMSWFFFKGGMTHKKISTFELAQKSFRRLLLPYFLFLIIGIVLDAVIKYSKDPDLQLVTFAKEELATILYSSIVLPTAASWFLLSLFMTRMTFNILYTYIKVHPLLIVVSFVCVAYLIYIINCPEFGIDIFENKTRFHFFKLPNYLGNMCHGLALYSLGYYLKTNQYNHKIFIISVLVFSLKFCMPAEIDFRSNISQGTHFVIAVLYGMSGCIIINNIFRKIANREIPLISHIGKNSMVYYLVHYPVIVTTISFCGACFESLELWLRFLLLSLVVTVSLVLAEFIFRVKIIRFVIGG